jgi:DNA-binding response OmpR family regulator
MSEDVVPASRRTILITKGFRAALDKVPSFLQRAAFRPLTARSGSEVLTLARTSDPSLILIDYALPDLTADEVCREIRREARLAGVPVVVLGPGDPGWVQHRCGEAGCSLFVADPPDATRLLPRLAAYLNVPHRASRRASVILSVARGAVTSEHLGRSRDLSVGGMRLQTPLQLQQGSYVNLRFHLGEEKEPIVAPGQVVRVFQEDEGVFDVGIRFLSLPHEAEVRIERLLEGIPG